MKKRARPPLKLLVLGAAMLLTATLGCDSQTLENGGTCLGNGALFDAFGSGISNAIASLAEALVLTLFT